MKTFIDIITAWPTQADFARDIGVSDDIVNMWKYRKSTIPPQHWIKIVRAGARREIPGVTLERMARMAEAKKTA